MWKCICHLEDEQSLKTEKPHLIWLCTLVWNKGPGIPIHPIADPLIKRLKHQEDKSLCLWSLVMVKAKSCAQCEFQDLLCYTLLILMRTSPQNKACHCSMSFKILVIGQHFRNHLQHSLSNNWYLILLSLPYDHASFSVELKISKEK